jgi:hypothetical protein
MRGTIVRAGAFWHHEVMRAPLVWVLSGAVLAQESLAQVGDLGSLLTAEPALVVGLLLQVPAGLVALLLVRTLLRAALGVALARRSAQVVRLSLTSAGAAFASSPLRTPALASRHAGRAPPLPA